jgi:GxxExxY protein
VEALDRELPELCSGIFNALSSKELEATFQRCLARDLTDAGVHIEQEVEIQLMYKGRRVGSRRADIVLQTPGDGQRVVLELKAVGTLTSERLKQLKFYMHHLNIDKGYLINFPHDSGFPDTPIAVDGSVFKHEVTLGDPQLSDRSTRDKHADATVQIVKVVRSHEDVRILEPPSILRIQKVQSTSVPQSSGVESPPQKSRPLSICVSPVAKFT